MPDGALGGGVQQRAAKRRALLGINEIRRRKRQRLFYEIFPDETRIKPAWCDQVDGDMIYARDLYPRHMEFFEAGAHYTERCFMAANRVGKTMGGAYELSAHLTGDYPKWWKGRRFDRPIRAWASGKTFETTRDILQRALLGGIERHGVGRRPTGEGLIPGERILHQHATFKAGVPDLIDTINIRHVSGGASRLGFKAYQQGRGSFEGTAQHAILFDEEPPLDVYGEALIRVMTTSGLIMLTFTPVEGMSQVVESFLGVNDIADLDAKSSLDLV